eukprot:2379885-Amphidinium_carterae.1
MDVCGVHDVLMDVQKHKAGSDCRDPLSPAVICATPSRYNALCRLHELLKSYKFSSRCPSLTKQDDRALLTGLEGSMCKHGSVD